MNSQALEYYHVLRSHKARPKRSLKTRQGLSQVMERSEPPPEVVNVFFRTTSLTPSRPDIARQGRVKARVIDQVLLCYDDCHCYCHCYYSLPACMLNHRMQVRHLLCECGGGTSGGRARARAGYF